MLLQSFFLRAINVSLTKYATGSPNGLLNAAFIIEFWVIPKSYILFIRLELQSILTTLADLPKGNTSSVISSCTQITDSDFFIA